MEEGHDCSQLMKEECWAEKSRETDDRPKLDGIQRRRKRTQVTERRQHRTTSSDKEMCSRQDNSGQPDENVTLFDGYTSSKSDCRSEGQWIGGVIRIGRKRSRRYGMFDMKRICQMLVDYEYWFPSRSAWGREHVKTVYQRRQYLKNPLRYPNEFGMMTDSVPLTQVGCCQIIMCESDMLCTFSLRWWLTWEESPSCLCLLAY